MKSRESIATRISTTVTLIMVVTVLLIGAAVYWRANRMVSAEVGRSAFSQLELVSGSIDDLVGEALQASRATADEMTRLLVGDPEEGPQRALTLAEDLTEEQIDRYVWHLALCSQKSEQAWYKQVYNNREAQWIDPAGGMGCTYAMPLFAPDSALLGVLALDLGTDWVDNIANRIQIFEHSYPLVISPNGRCINHPDIGVLFTETMSSSREDTKEDILLQVADKALSNGKGATKVAAHDFRATAFYVPVESTEWEVAVVCSFTDVYAGLEKFLFFSLLLVLLFSIVVIGVVNAAVSKATAPLSELAKMARKVAVGEFDAQLPEKGNRSEMADLYESFGFMQESLARNIEELKKTTAEQERLESEFHIARKIQLDLVPTIFPAFPDRKDIDIHAVMNPWRESGGNLYDFGITDNKLLFFIGDVAGKGMMAAIFMSTTFKLIHSALYNHASPAETLSFANKTMALNNESDMFVTLFFGSLDLETGRLTYCSAGQDEPMLVTPGGEVKPLDVVPNVPVGLMQETEYEEQETTIAPGSMLVLYTDGVVEAQNYGGDLYGTDRLIRRLKQHAQKDCRQVVEAIRDDVRLFAREDSGDDCTALAIRWR